MLVGAVVLSVMATAGISVAKGKSLRSSECVQLARMVAGRQHPTERDPYAWQIEKQAYAICARDPVTFRRLIRAG